MRAHVTSHRFRRQKDGPFTPTNSQLRTNGRYAGGWMVISVVKALVFIASLRALRCVYLELALGFWTCDRSWRFQIWCVVLGIELMMVERLLKYTWSSLAGSWMRNGEGRVD